ncbi:hypothetical protein DFJ73DRAFT_806381 [Zopfochytrium polystomum]|nr:hypothetical protein DFJ73DRAFT_806381 [Zopfochytrium polystomum]
MSPEGSPTAPSEILVLPWRDYGNREGVDGVLRVLPADVFPNSLTSSGEATVRNLMDAVNNHLDSRRVTAILLHGCRIPTNQVLDPLLDAFSTGSPRFLAIARPLADCIVVQYKTLKGPTYRAECSSTDTVAALKTEIYFQTRVWPDEQALVHAGKLLSDHATLEGCGITANTLIYLSMRSRPQTHQFAVEDSGSVGSLGGDPEAAPNWRVCTRGANVEGRCDSKSCAAFDQLVLCPQGIGLTVVTHDRVFACPACRSGVKLLDCCFLDCIWKYEAVSSHDHSTATSQWRLAPFGQIERLTSFGAGAPSSWDSIFFYVRLFPPSLEREPAHSSAQTQPGECVVCWNDLVAGEEVQPFFWFDQHSAAHRTCAEMWASRSGQSDD